MCNKYILILFEIITLIASDYYNLTIEYLKNRKISKQNEINSINKISYFGLIKYKV